MTKKMEKIFDWLVDTSQKYKLYILLPLMVFFLLVAKNPFSERTLIPNFEPFPDTFHYLLPARCIISSGTWNLCRPHTQGKDPDVAPLYSAVFIPFFLILNDPRMFYFANVLLALGSFILLERILTGLKIHPFIQFSVLMVAATSYHLYWLPSLAMAENLVVFIFLLNLWLFQRKELSMKIFGVVAAVGFYGTKYAFAPLSVLFILLHLLTIWKHSKKNPYWRVAVVGVLALAGLLLLVRSESVLSLFSSTFLKFSLTESEAQRSWFSLSYLSKYVPQYLSAIFGQPTVMLWDRRALFPWYLSLVSAFGLAWGVMTPSFRKISLVVLLSVVSQLLFISTFYAFDGRYILHVIYALLIGLAIFLSLVLSVFKKKQYVLLTIVGVTLLYLLTQATIIRYQIVLNIKYAETPWYYIATRQIDAVLASKGENTVLITAIPVHFFDFFGSSNYIVMPISQEQEREKKDLMYGSQYNYDNLPLLYESLLKQGYDVYLSNYGLGHAGYMHEEYALITDRFTTNIVADGCHGSCNLYQLKLKELE